MKKLKFIYALFFVLAFVFSLSFYTNTATAGSLKPYRTTCVTNGEIDGYGSRCTAGTGNCLENLCGSWKELSNSFTQQ